MFETLKSNGFGSLDCLEQGHHIYYTRDLDVV